MTRNEGFFITLLVFARGVGDVLKDGHVADTLIRTLGAKLDSCAAKDLRGELDKLFNPGTPAKLLHHYLGAEALKGFLESGVAAGKKHRLWASLATHLNDYEEILHGQRLVRDQLAAFCEKDEAARDFFARLTKEAIKWEEALKPELPWTNIFVASFTELEDSLSMWRGYTDQRGYGLAFAVNAWPKTVFLTKVIYDEDVACLDPMFGALLRFYQGFDGPNGSAGRLFETLKRALGLAAAVYKKRHWSEEKEWRLIQWCEESRPTDAEKHIQFRVRRGRLIPYHEIALPEELELQKITFGPGYNEATERRALEMVCESYLPGVSVQATKVPLRID